MKVIARLLTALALGVPCLVGAQDLVDADGYPIMYVRGTFNKWGVGDDTKMTRQGDEYSITLGSLNGDFKVGNADWTVNYGGTISDVVISESATVPVMSDGANLGANKLTDVKLSFTLQRNGKELLPTFLKVTVNGMEPPEPGPMPVTGLSGTLPVLYINAYLVDADGKTVLDANGKPILDNELISADLSHKNYFQAEYWLDVNDCKWMEAEGAKSIGSAQEPLPMEIKARGNFTRTAFAKKPFKLKLGKKQNLLGLTPDKSKHYALLAHADDNYGYMRNFVGFDLGARIELPWTPKQQPVEVVINNNYRGLYFLTESIRVGDGRVDIVELKDDTQENYLISGGYLVELDNYDEPTENQISMEEKSCVPGHYLDKLRITFNTPESYSPIMRRFVTNQFSAMNDMVGANSDDLWAYMDMTDAVRYYLVKEIISDVESYHGSTYMYRNYGANQKWHFSPLWDCGNAFNGSSTNYFYDCDPFGNTWIPSMRTNEKFNQMLVETWKWFMSSRYNGLISDIDEYVEHIKAAAVADAARWKNAPTPAGGLPVVNNSDMASARTRVLDKLAAKIAWLAEQWGSYDGVYPEPAPDTTPAAPLPEYAQTGIEAVLAGDKDSDGAPAEYFDMQGRSVQVPAHGLYIMRRGSQVTKVAR